MTPYDKFTVFRPIYALGKIVRVSQKHELQMTNKNDRDHSQ